MKRPIIVLTILFILLSFVYYSVDKQNQTFADNFTAYDYIKRNQGYARPYIKEKFPQIKVDKKDPKIRIYDPNLDMKNGYTLLTYAFYKKDVSFTKMLVNEKKADIHKRDKLGNSVITILLGHEKYDLASDIMKQYKIVVTKEEIHKYLNTASNKDATRKWAQEHKIIGYDEKLINKRFSRLDGDKQLEIILSDTKVYQKNIDLYKARLFSQNLETFFDAYNKAPFLFTQKDKLSIFNRIVSDSKHFDANAKFLKLVIHTNIKISKQQAQELKNDFLNDTRHKRSSQRQLSLYLYQLYPEIFDKDKELSNAIYDVWPDFAQILINDGAKDTSSYKRLNAYDKSRIEMMKVLIDAGYGFSKKQYKIYHDSLLKNGSYYYQFIPQDKQYLALTSNETYIFAVKINNKTHTLKMQRLDSKLHEQWSKDLPGHYNNNYANRVLGLYSFSNKLLLVEQKVLNRSVRTKLTVFTEDGTKIKEHAMRGEFSKAVFSNHQFFIKTTGEEKYFDKDISLIKAYTKKERLLQKRKKFYRHDLEIRTKFLPEKTFNLSYYRNDDVTRLYVDNINSKDPISIILAKKDHVVLDITQTKDANYVISQTLTTSTIQKLTRDYGEYGFHYIKKKEDKSISDMKHVVKTLHVENNHTIIVGQNNKLPSLEIFDATKKKVIDKSYKFSFLRGHITGVKKLKNKDILIVGRLYEKYNYKKVFTARLDAKGIPKWSRIYDKFRFIDNILLEGDTFISLADDEPVKFSLSDGEVQTSYKELEDSRAITTMSSGLLFAIANKKSKKSSYSKKIYQPFVYCYSKDRKSYTKTRVSEEGSYLDDIYTKDDKVYAILNLPKEQTTANTNQIIINIDKKCQINYKWNN